MSLTLLEIEKEALRLPAADRERLASDIFKSVHGQTVNEVDQAWLELAEERYQSLMLGDDSGIAGQDFFEKVEGKLQWK